MLSFLLFAGIFALPEIVTFSEWHGVFGRNANRYSKLKSMASREMAFIHNLATIRAHNAKNHPWKMAVNRFSDLTGDEFKELMNFATCRKHMNVTRRLREKRQKGKLQQVRNPKNAATVDWRSTNNPLGKVAVTPVKNQGGCGSCWSFSASGAVEGAWVVGGNSLVSLSEQELVSCDKQDNACNGGLMDYAFEYVKTNGLTTEDNYPYVSGDGQVPACDTSKVAQKSATINDYVDVQTQSEDALENALNIGPVAIAIEADQYSFQSYTSGVLTASCGDSLDHGVLAVGYGHDSDSNLDYWIVKNSWGSSWGLDGYVLLERHISSTSGQCGILMQPSYPVAGQVLPTPKPTPNPHPSSNYEDPGEKGENGCNTGEKAVINFFEIPGRMCMPICTADSDCPVTPTGWNAASCELETDDTMLCAVECSDAVPCHGGTVCTSIEGIVSICLYE
jgi:KDEL-tailed cysteine endopeptidase